MSAASPVRPAAVERQPGRRATDAEKHLGDLTHELAKIERENDLLRSAQRATAAEIARFRADALAHAKEVASLTAMLQVQQALRVKAEKQLAIAGRRTIQNMEK